MSYKEVENKNEKWAQEEHFNKVLHSQSPTWKELIDMLAVIQAQNQINSNYIAIYLAKQTNPSLDNNELINDYLNKMDISMSGLIQTFTDKFHTQLSDRLSK